MTTDSRGDSDQQAPSPRVRGDLSQEAFWPLGAFKLRRGDSDPPAPQGALGVPGATAAAKAAQVTARAAARAGVRVRHERPAARPSNGTHGDFPPAPKRAAGRCLAIGSDPARNAVAQAAGFVTARLMPGGGGGGGGRRRRRMGW